MDATFRQLGVFTGGNPGQHARRRRAYATHFPAVRTPAKSTVHAVLERNGKAPAWAMSAHP